MVIISKFKDFYDFLQGKYGIDPKAVLNRTDYTPSPEFWDEGASVTFYICDYQVMGYYRENRWNYGDAILKYEEKAKFSSWLHNIPDSSGSRMVKVKGMKDQNGKAALIDVSIDIVKRSNFTPCSELNIPILKIGHTGYTPKLTYKNVNFCPHPKLKDYNFGSAVTPESMYLLLTDFLLREVEVPNNQTNKEKILAHGFDFKHSFRNTK